MLQREFRFQHFCLLNDTYTSVPMFSSCAWEPSDIQHQGRETHLSARGVGVAAIGISRVLGFTSWVNAENCHYGDAVHDLSGPVWAAWRSHVRKCEKGAEYVEYVVHEV